MARILVLTNLYPPHHFGGYELSCHDVVTRWRAWGHDVTILTSDFRKSGVAEAPEDPRDVRRELRIAFDGRELQQWPLASRLDYERHNQEALKRAVRELQPDVVSVWHMAGMSLSLLHRLARDQVPLVGVVCDEWPIYIERTDQWMRFWRRLPPVWRVVGKLTGVPTGFPDIGGCASFCFVSNDLRDRCLSRSHWRYSRSTVTYSGIDTDVFPITAEAAKPTWSWRLVTAGRLDHRKGFDTAIRALRHLPPESGLQILSSADAPYRAELEAQAADLGVADRVVFSVTDRAGVRAAFSEADVVLFPSVWEEPFGLVPVEAMACGVPVIASGTGGSSEFLADGHNCLLFAPGDPSSLSDAIGHLASSSELRGRLVEQGKETARELTVDRLAVELETWHLAAVTGFRDGVPGPPRDLRQYIRERRPLE